MQRERAQHCIITSFSIQGVGGLLSCYQPPSSSLRCSSFDVWRESGWIASGCKCPRKLRRPPDLAPSGAVCPHRTEAIKLFVLLQSKWPTENVLVFLYVFTVDVFSDLCYKVNRNYFCKHVTVVKQNCISLDIYITSLKALEWNLTKKKISSQTFQLETQFQILGSLMCRLSYMIVE